MLEPPPRKDSTLRRVPAVVYSAAPQTQAETMGSLFDLAADLSQYARKPPQEDEEVDDRQLHTRLGSSPRGVVKLSPSPEKRSDLPYMSSNQETGDASAPLSTLSLLDEALSTIYEARQPQLRPSKLPSGLVYQRSAPDLHYRDCKTEAEQLKTHRAPTRSPSFATANPLQKVFSQSLVTKPNPTHTAESVRKRIPPPPALLSASVRALSAGNYPQTTQDSDVEARTALRELQEEIEQLPRDALATAADIQRHQRVLLDKYLGNRLNDLPSTPFVLLAKRKIQQKIDQLRVKPALQPTTQLSKSEGDEQVTAASPPTSMASLTLPVAQHEMLVKLARIPESHVAKLSSTQQKMVQFAKRYDKILKLSSDELQRLPVSQAQLLQQLRDQLPKEMS